MRDRILTDLYASVGVGAVIGLVAYVVLHTFGRATGLCH